MNHHLQHDTFADIPDLHSADRVLYSSGMGSAAVGSAYAAAASKAAAAKLAQHDKDYTPPSFDASKTTAASNIGGAIDKAASDGAITSVEQKTIFKTAKATPDDVNSSVSRYHDAVAAAAATSDLTYKDSTTGSSITTKSSFDDAQRVQRMENGVDGKGANSNGNKGVDDIVDSSGSLVYSTLGDANHNDGTADNADGGKLGSAHNVDTWNAAISKEQGIIAAAKNKGQDATILEGNLTKMIEDRDVAQGAEASIVKDVKSRMQYVGGLQLQKQTLAKQIDPSVAGSPAKIVQDARTNLKNFKNVDALPAAVSADPGAVLTMSDSDYAALKTKFGDTSASPDTASELGKQFFDSVDSYRKVGSPQQVAWKQYSEAKAASDSIDTEIAGQQATIKRYTSVLSASSAAQLTSTGTTATGSTKTATSGPTGEHSGAAGAAAGPTGAGTGKAVDPGASNGAGGTPAAPTTAQLRTYLASKGYGLNSKNQVTYTVKRGDYLINVAHQANTTFAASHAKVSYQQLAVLATFDAHPDLAKQTHSNANDIWTGESLIVPISLDDLTSDYEASQTSN